MIANAPRHALSALLLLSAAICILDQAGADVTQAMSDTRSAALSNLDTLGRRLQQSGVYLPNSVPLGSRTGSGLLIYTPANCSYLDPDDFGNFFANAYQQNSVPGIYLSSGNYSVFSGTAKAWTIHLGCYVNGARSTPFEIDMGGSVLTFTNNNEAGFAVDQCNQVYMHSFTATYSAAALPNTQGTITSLQQGGTWNVQIDPGYPTSFLDGRSLVSYAVTTPTGWFVPNSTAIRGAGPYTAVAGSSGQYTLNVPFTVPNVVAGNKIAISAGTAAPPFILCYICNSVTLSSINIYSSNYFGVSDYLSSNITYNGVSVAPNPQGIGGIVSLLSSNDDGFRSVAATNGPRFTGCNVTNSGGDGISIIGNYYLTAAVYPNNNTVVIASGGCGDPGCITVKTGDLVSLYASSLQPLGAATVTAIASTSNPGTISSYSQQQTFFNYDNAVYFSLSFSALPAAWALGGPDGLLSSPAENGLRASLFNNSVTNVVNRGVYYTGSNGTISGNVVQQPLGFGVSLASSVFYLQADIPSSLLVEKNFVNATYGGMQLTMINRTGLPSPYPAARNVTIRYNTVIRTQKPLLVTSAASLTVLGNTFTDTACYPFVNQDLFSFVPPNAVVYAAYLTNSSFSQNSASLSGSVPCPNGNAQSPYYQGPGLVNTSFLP